MNYTIVKLNRVYRPTHERASIILKDRHTLIFFETIEYESMKIIWLLVYFENTLMPII